MAVGYLMGMAAGFVLGVAFAHWWLFEHLDRERLFEIAADE